MGKKVVPTKLDIIKDLHFDIDLPSFLKITENSEREQGIHDARWGIFKIHLDNIAARASEINDPVLNLIMLRMNMYEVTPEERIKYISEFEKEIAKAIKEE